MKKLLYVLLAMTVAFAMVGCGGDDDPVVTPVVTPPPGLPPQSDTDVRFIFQDGTFADVAFTAGDTVWSDIKKTDTTFTGDTKIFGGWEDNGRSKKFKVGDNSADTEVIQDALTLTAIWYNNVLTDSTALEKTWLGNTQYPVYKFDVTGKDVTKITGIKASFKLSEATVELVTNLRPVRAMGPYYFSTDPIEVENDLFFGDFAIDANGTYAAKFNSNGTKKIEDFNKFHPYLLSNGDPTMTGVAGFNKGTNGTAPTANTWFDVTIATSGYGWNGDTNSIAKNIEYREAAEDRDSDGEVQGVEILNDATDFNTVYFGIGLANNQDAHGAANGTAATVWQHGITALVKDVQIIFDDDTTVTGTKPAFPAYTVTWGKGANPAVPNTVVAKPNQTTDQVFAAYIYAVQYNWRGAPTATIAPPADPTYVPPVNPPAVEATADFDVDLTGAGFTVINDTAWDAINQVLSVGTITFPAGLDARSYKKFTIKAEAYAADGVTRIYDVGSSYGAGFGIGYVKFLFGDVNWAEIATVYNLNCGDGVSGEGDAGQTVNANIPTQFNDVDVSRGLKIAIQNGDASVAYIKVTKITFLYQ
jgi:hypothetical protein